MVAWSLVGAVLVGPPLPAQQRAAEHGVRYRSAETVYLDAGGAAGIAVGDRFEAWRDGRRIGEVEVIFAAERSASARVVAESVPIAPGDRLRRVGGAPSPSAPAAPQAATPRVDPPREAPAPAAERASPERQASPTPRRRATRVSGSLGLEWRSTTSGGESGESREATRSLLRVNVRGRDLGGTPLQLRLRGRLLDLSRTATSAELGPPASGNRLYEAALVWDPPDSFYAVHAGRLGAGSLLSLGYLDGALIEVRALGRLAAGVVYGQRVEDAALGSSGDTATGAVEAGGTMAGGTKAGGTKAGGTKAGAFLRFTDDRALASAERSYEVVLAGFQESADDPRFDRRYVALESHFQGGSRWSFFQHAEVDLATGGDGEDGGTQLSVAGLSLVRSLARGGRLSLSYDRFQSYPTEEDLLVPPGFLDRLARQGLRLGWSRESAGGLRLGVDLGARFREDGPPIHPQLGPFGEAERTFSLRLGVHHSQLPGGLTGGVDATVYTSAAADGAIAALRVGKRFAGGHEIDLSLGANAWQAPLDDRLLGWGRAAVWIELPANLFLRGEVELQQGEGLDGTRASVGVGYRL